MSVDFTSYDPEVIEQWPFFVLARTLEASIGQLPNDVWGLSLHLTPDTYDATLVFKATVFKATTPPNRITEDAADVVRIRLAALVGPHCRITTQIDESPGYLVHVDDVLDPNVHAIFSGLKGLPYQLDRPMPETRPGMPPVNGLPVPPDAVTANSLTDYVTTRAARATLGDLPASTLACGVRINGLHIVYVFQLSTPATADTDDEIDWITDGFNDGTVDFATLDVEVSVVDAPDLSDPTVHWIYAHAT